MKRILPNEALEGDLIVEFRRSEALAEGIGRSHDDVELIFRDANVQLTYGDLRETWDGDRIAFINEQQRWFITATPNYPNEPFSDVIAYTATSGDIDRLAGREVS